MRISPCLDEVEDDEYGEECVEVDVEGEAPLDVVDAAARRPQEILVAQRPQARRDHQTAANQKKDEC